MSDYLGRVASRARGEARGTHALAPRPAVAFESPSPTPVALEVEGGAPNVMADVMADAMAAPALAAPPLARGAPAMQPPVALRRPAAAPGATKSEAPAARRSSAPRTVELAVPAEPAFGSADEALAVEPAIADAAVDASLDASGGEPQAASLHQRITAALGPRPPAPSPARAAASPQRHAALVAASASETAPSGDQVVQVTIGRIDVRAAVAAPPPPSPRPREPMLTLADYLRGGTR